MAIIDFITTAALDISLLRNCFIVICPIPICALVSSNDKTIFCNIADGIRDSIWDSIWDSIGDNIWESIRGSKLLRNLKRNMLYYPTIEVGSCVHFSTLYCLFSMFLIVPITFVSTQYASALSQMAINESGDNFIENTKTAALKCITSRFSNMYERAQEIIARKV